MVWWRHHYLYVNFHKLPQKSPGVWGLNFLNMVIRAWKHCQTLVCSEWSRNWSKWPNYILNGYHHDLFLFFSDRFLQLVLKDPAHQVKSGLFSCEINVVTMKAHGLALTSSAIIDNKLPTIQDLVSSLKYITFTLSQFEVFGRKGVAGIDKANR